MTPVDHPSGGRSGGLGGFIYRRRLWVLGLSGICLLLAILALLRGGPLTTGRIVGLESERAAAVADEANAHSERLLVIAVMESPDLDPRDPGFRAAMTQALAPIRADPHVQSVLAPDLLPSFLTAELLSPKFHAALAIITLRGPYDDAEAAYPALRARLQSDRLSIACTGAIPFTTDLDRTLERDLLRAELISLPLALLVLLLVFRTVVAALLPVGVGALAVLGGIGVVMALSHWTEMAQYTINVCSLIGLGVAIDYSLFVVSRYREELARGADYERALTGAVRKAGRVVAFSGLAVGVGLAGLLFFEGSYLSAMGIGGAVVVALAVVFALTFLPALLAILGPRIHAGALPHRRGDPINGAWRAIAGWVMRRPVLVLVPSLGLLFVMAAPIRDLRLAAADVHAFGPEVEARRGFDLLASAFPVEAETAILVTAEFPPGSTPGATRTVALGALYRRLQALPGVTRVLSVGDGPSASALYAFTTAPPQSDAARALVESIRENRQVGDGTLFVGGVTADAIDSTSYLAARAPRAALFVVGVTVLVLFLLLRSVLLPLKAVVMNALSIAASFGAIVWIFQGGRLWVREGGPLEPSLPILLFCILFGLSMDYEVLMLSRMKEAWEAGGDNSAAVADGLERSAGLITSAAAIMVAVFAAFALARVVLIQVTGVGMALAVALDATLVRVLVVPAAMRLFGRFNWWAPSWLGGARPSRPAARIEG
jgi:RND superfamily putative drug exporter